jgi:hypothetical protein
MPSWNFAVEIESLGGRHYVRVIENGSVTMRRFDRVMDAEQCAETERMRLGLAKAVRCGAFKAKPVTICGHWLSREWHAVAGDTAPLMPAPFRLAASQRCNRG